MKKYALISVSDKTGVVALAQGLCLCGYSILSTGGTAKLLEQNAVPVSEVSSLTGFPECLDGRVKTLHPKVHAGILAKRSEPSHMAQLESLGIDTIDVVVINLYPFKATIAKKDAALADAIENIDIGGPTMLRSAAKNYEDVCVVTDPCDYDALLSALKSGSVPLEQKFLWAQKVFEHTANYDSMIARYLGEKAGVEYPEKLSLTFERKDILRYGENPHQTAAFYEEPLNAGGTLADALQLQGKELSYNNINDTSAALELLAEFSDQPCAVAVKHANACGVGVGSDIAIAFQRAYDSDPVSIYGGIVALNRPVDEACAALLSPIFLEVVVAPAYSEQALAILSKKKNLRLLTLALGERRPERMQIKQVMGGLLVQSPDISEEHELTVATDRAPDEKERKALAFAWKVCKHIRSNAIVLAKDGRTVGVGPGQTNRITALDLAIRYAGEDAEGSVLASDAYFPFKDCVEAAHKAGITAIIQPGGSIRDQESIEACNRYGIAMVFTGRRHFRH